MVCCVLPRVVVVSIAARFSSNMMLQSRVPRNPWGMNSLLLREAPIASGNLRRFLRCLLNAEYVPQKSQCPKYSWVMSQAAIRHRRDDPARCSAFCFPYWQSYLPCAYTQWLSLWSSGRSVGRSHENDCHEFSQRPRRADGFVTPPATSIACKHTRILHHAKHPALSPRHIRCVHARLRTALVEKRIFALWVARCNEISRQRRAYIWLLPDLSPSAFNPVNISKLIRHITWEHTQTLAYLAY